MDGNAPDSFSAACGLAGPLKVRIEDPSLSCASLHEFHRPFFVVGRDGRADLPIDSPEVSRRHAYFQVVAGRIFCVDLMSRSGIRWYEGVRPLGWVDRGRGVEVGPARIRFEFEGSDTGSEESGNLPVSRSFESSSLAEARLEFLGAESHRPSWQLSRALVLIGRSATCRIHLDDPKIAKMHAALIRTSVGIWAVDLLGRNDGLRVGGRSIRSVQLEDGDEIELGDHRIRIRIGEAARPPGKSELARRLRGQEWRPSPVDAGPPSGPGPKVGAAGLGLEDLNGSLDPVTARLFDQFDRIHQQTTEQFRQAILMMFRMHQDQMEVIRDELSRLDRLEEEQRSLQAELARGHRPRPAPITLRLVSGDTASLPLPSEAARPARVRPEVEQPTGRKPPEISDSGIGGPRKVALSAPLPDSDPHDRLSRRLAEIQGERQGLWKKLLGSLTGGESDRVLP